MKKLAISATSSKQQFPSYTIIFFLYILFKIFFLGENLNTNFTFNTKLKGNVGQCQGVCLDRFQTIN